MIEERCIPDLAARVKSPTLPKGN